MKRCRHCLRELLSGGASFCLWEKFILTERIFLFWLICVIPSSVVTCGDNRALVNVGWRGVWWSSLIVCGCSLTLNCSYCSGRSASDSCQPVLPWVCAQDSWILPSWRENPRGECCPAWCGFCVCCSLTGELDAVLRLTREGCDLAWATQELRLRAPLSSYSLASVRLEQTYIVHKPSITICRICVKRSLEMLKKLWCWIIKMSPSFCIPHLPTCAPFVFHLTTVTWWAEQILLFPRQRWKYELHRALCTCPK